MTNLALQALTLITAQVKVQAALAADSEADLTEILI